MREGFTFTEGPLGMPDGGLYFTDLRDAQRVHRLDPGGRISVVREKSKRTLYITAQEGLYRMPTLTAGPDRLGK